MNIKKLERKYWILGLTILVIFLLSRGEIVESYYVQSIEMGDIKIDVVKPPYISFSMQSIIGKTTYTSFEQINFKLSHRWADVRDKDSFKTFVDPNIIGGGTITRESAEQGYYTKTEYFASWVVMLIDASSENNKNVIEVTEVPLTNNDRVIMLQNGKIDIDFTSRAPKVSEKKKYIIRSQLQYIDSNKVGRVAVTEERQFTVVPNECKYTESIAGSSTRHEWTIKYETCDGVTKPIAYSTKCKDGYYIPYETLGTLTGISGKYSNEPISFYWSKDKSGFVECVPLSEWVPPTQEGSDESDGGQPQPKEDDSTDTQQPPQEEENNTIQQQEETDTPEIEQPDLGCESDTECPEGQYCVDGQCVEKNTDDLGNYLIYGLLLLILIVILKGSR